MHTGTLIININTPYYSQHHSPSVLFRNISFTLSSLSNLRKIKMASKRASISGMCLFCYYKSDNQNWYWMHGVNSSQAYAHVCIAYVVNDHSALFLRSNFRYSWSNCWLSSCFFTFWCQHTVRWHMLLLGSADDLVKMSPLVEWLRISTRHQCSSYKYSLRNDWAKK